MPLPHRFLSGGASAANHIPQLATAGSRRTIGGAFVQHRGITSASTSVRQLLRQDTNSACERDEHGLRQGPAAEGGARRGIKITRHTFSSPQERYFEKKAAGTGGPVMTRFTRDPAAVASAAGQKIHSFFSPGERVEGIRQPRIHKNFPKDQTYAPELSIKVGEAAQKAMPEVEDPIEPVKHQNPYVAELKRLNAISIQVHQITDEVCAIRYARFVKGQGGEFEPLMEISLEALKKHIEEIKAYLSEESVKKLDYQVESALYPFSSHLGRLRKKLLDQTQNFLRDAYSIANRKINAGETDTTDIRAIAKLAEKTVSHQKSKTTWKIVNVAPTWESLSIHEALAVSQGRLHELGCHIEKIRRSFAGEHGPLLLRADSVVKQPSRWKINAALSIPPIRKGGQKQFFQPHPNQLKGKIERPTDPSTLHYIGQNTLQWKEAEDNVPYRRRKKDNEVTIKWYHKEELAEPIGDHRYNVRSYSSKKRWEQSHVFKGVVPTEFSILPITKTFNTAPVSDPRQYIGTDTSPPQDGSVNSKGTGPFIYRYKLMKYGDVPSAISRPGLPSAEDRVNAPKPTPESLDTDTVQQFDDKSPFQYYNKQDIAESNASSGSPSSEAPKVERTLASFDRVIPRVRYHISESPPLLSHSYQTTDSPFRRGTRNQGFHTSATQYKDSPPADSKLRARQVFSTDVKQREKETPYPQKNREGALRRKLQLEELDRKSSLAALRQGQAYQNSGVTIPSEEMLEEEDYVRSLTDLASGSVEDITETSGMEFMDVGDLIELRSFGGDSELGIFIQPPLAKNGEFLFLTETGKLKTWPTTGMVFTIPKFTSVESAELLRKHIGQLADEAERINPPRQLTKPLTDKIREFHVQALNVFAKKLPLLESLYDKYSDDTETKLLTTHEAAKHAFPDGYQNHHVYAVHLALMGDPRRFIADSGRDHKRTGQFEVRSRQELSTLRKVTDWLRLKSVTLSTGQTAKKPSEVIQKFVQKAATIIDKSREMRDDQAQNFQPVEAVPLEDLAWDENDKEIIEFLKFSLERYWFQASPTKALYPQLLRATERYQDEWMLDVDLLYIFLQEIGVFRPWENQHRFSHRVPLPFHGKSPEEDKLAERVAEVNKDVEVAFQKLGLKDKMEHLREDIPETIYAIDDASAEEIDDGISIVPISETESWVRIHIANPTAFIEPGSWIGEMTAKQQTTLYLPERTFAMMPRGLVDYKFGLDSDRPTITISAKINHESGEISDYKIFPGKAQTVKRITYTQYNDVLGFKTPKTKQIVVNPPRDPKTSDVIESAERPAPAPIGDEEAKLLHSLRGIAIALRKKRAKAGSLSFITEDFNIRVNEHAGQPTSANGVAISPDIPILYKGLPTITFTPGTGPTPAHETVAEFMLLGGTVMATFLSTHGVPAPYRAHSLSPRKGTQKIWEDILLPARNEMGLIDKKILREHFTVLGASRLQPFPGTHQLLGITADKETGIGGYTKSTSPLRRYTDMLTHYQLEQLILNLHQGLPATQSLPFSEAFFAHTLPLIMTHERRIRSIQQNSEKFWVYKLIRLGILEAKHVQGREHIMPKQYTIKLTTKNQFPAPSMGMLEEFGIPVKLWFKDAKDWENAEWGCRGTADVDDTNWSRVKVNMRWKGMLPDDE
ncbi:hypothetical protein DFH27DRAFT_574276 [Peziza echinospora]|nr:hypothetical protein DFH27DRAFT_574276 [Peziza echinospora]